MLGGGGEGTAYGEVGGWDADYRHVHTKPAKFENLFLTTNNIFSQFNVDVQCVMVRWRRLISSGVEGIE